MNTKLHDENVDFLFDAILMLENREECYRFFEDLCTVPELKAMSQRLAVAKMLNARQVYSEIVAETGASTATISRVSKCLSGGAGGYRTVLKRIESGEISDDGVLRVDCLEDDEAAAVKAIVACLKNKNGKA